MSSSEKGRLAGSASDQNAPLLRGDKSVRDLIFDFKGLLLAERQPIDVR